MDENDNALAPSKRRSPFAVLSAFVAGLTLACVALSSLAYSQGYAGMARNLAYGQLLFPLGIVAGHMARRQLQRNSSAYTGAGWASFGLAIGYLNLIIAALILTMAVIGR